MKKYKLKLSGWWREFRIIYVLPTIRLQLYKPSGFSLEIAWLFFGCFIDLYVRRKAPQSLKSLRKPLSKDPSSN